MMKALAMVLGVVGLGACSAATEPAAPEQPAAAPVVAAAPSSAPAEPAATATTAVAPAPSATSTPAVEDNDIEYPVHGLATIPADCKEPSVVLTTAPKSRGWDYDWIWTRQALFANPQFKLVDWPNKPAKPMDVRLDMIEIPGGFALVGVCKDGATCTKLAAMYKSVVPTCKPTLQCGAPPPSSPARASRLVPKDGKWLPSGDVIGECARIGVCTSMKLIAHDRNLGVACQNAPASFKTQCAELATCDDVVRCLR
jgi:hypothetical protein